MKKLILSWLIASMVILLLSVSGLYLTIWLFPGLAAQYFDPAFDTQSSRIMLYFIHPFVVSLALAWFWTRCKSILRGSFLTRGIEFGLIYTLVAIFPVMWLIYSAIHVSLPMVATWFLSGLLQGVVCGLLFEKINP